MTTHLKMRVRGDTPHKMPTTGDLSGNENTIEVTAQFHASKFAQSNLFCLLAH